jgi:hypothetical protein
LAAARPPGWAIYLGKASASPLDRAPLEFGPNAYAYSRSTFFSGTEAKCLSHSLIKKKLIYEKTAITVINMTRKWNQTANHGTSRPLPKYETRRPQKHTYI